MKDILFCVVLYGYTKNDSPTYKSLKRSGVCDKSIMLHDNRVKNHKLSIVYNKFLAKARKDDYRYIVFLDDDSHLHMDFFESLNFELDSEIYIPKLKFNDIFISPQRFGSIKRFCMSGVRVNMSKCHDLIFSEEYSLYGIDDYLMLFCLNNDYSVVESKITFHHEISTVNGYKGKGDFNKFKCLELLRGHVLNFKFSPIPLKFHFIKKQIVYIYKLAKMGFFKEGLLILRDPGKKTDFI